MEQRATNDIVAVISLFGQSLMRFGEALREAGRLTGLTVLYTFVPPYRIRPILHQMNYVAVESAPMVIFCVCFAAVVTMIEASFHMKIVVQNDALVPGFAALLILRELGAVVTGLLVTARVGAGLAAEVGTMKISEQLDALRMLGINPVRYLIVPRFLAGVFGGAILTIMANIVCLYCAMLVSQFMLGHTAGSFLTSMRAFVSFQDLVFATLKGAVFGGVIPIVSCFYGFRCQAGAEGVGFATTKSVVTTSILIIFLDFLMSWFFSNFY